MQHFDELVDTIIFFTNKQIRKEFKINYYEDCKTYFEELTNINEINNLKNMILEIIKNSPYNPKIMIITIIIFYYLTNKLEYVFSSNIYKVLEIENDVKNEIINCIEIILISDAEWCVKVRRFCDGFL